MIIVIYELKQVKENREYCEYWLPRAELLEAYEAELVKAAETIEAREREVARREQALEDGLCHEKADRTGVIETDEWDIVDEE